MIIYLHSENIEPPAKKNHLLAYPGCKRLGQTLKCLMKYFMLAHQNIYVILTCNYVYLLLYHVFFKTAEAVPVIHTALLIGKSYKDNTVSAG